MLFQSYGLTLAEQEAANIVKMVTDGPYVHAAIITDDKLNLIEARLDGVHTGVLLTKNNGSPFGNYQVCNIYTANKDDRGNALSLDRSAVDRALDWLNQQVQNKDPYGWCDIVDQGLDFLVHGNPIKVVQPGRFDCSNLATMFLFMCGIKLPFQPPFDVSPNDLGEFFGLLPSRHRVYPK